MKAGNLQKATVILSKIHELDKQVIAIEKKAMEVADGGNFIGVDISFEPEKKKDAEIDTDGFESVYKMMYFPSLLGNHKANDNKEKLKFNLSDTETLIVLGALIAIKKEQRKALCTKIFELGVNV